MPTRKSLPANNMAATLLRARAEAERLVSQVQVYQAGLSVPSAGLAETARLEGDAILHAAAQATANLLAQLQIEADLETPSTHPKSNRSDDGRTHE